VCAPDPNAGVREQARQEHKKKLQQYHSASLKYWNREAAAKQRSGALTTGLSRARSDAYSKALWALGKGRKANEQLHKKRAALTKYDLKRGVSRASRYMSGKYRDILNKQGQIESSINTTFGRNMDIMNQGITRRHQNYVAKNRERLGVRPEFGAPVMMPPKDGFGQMMNSIALGMQFASMAFAFPSDKRLKENIKEVGKSPKGHTIYEWNYKTNEYSRYRGAIAQEVAKIDPMAVDILPSGLLGIYYDKIDVNMEKIS
tara:strand:+ start:224 stop:1000 length:777 start_codon:yes stop_codon:yes gene_type:complete